MREKISIFEEKELENLIYIKSYYEIELTVRETDLNNLDNLKKFVEVSERVKALLMSSSESGRILQLIQRLCESLEIPIYAAKEVQQAIIYTGNPNNLLKERLPILLNDYLNCRELIEKITFREPLNNEWITNYAEIRTFFGLFYIDLLNLIETDRISEEPVKPLISIVLPQKYRNKTTLIPVLHYHYIQYYLKDFPPPEKQMEFTRREYLKIIAEKVYGIRIGGYNFYNFFTGLEPKISDYGLVIKEAVIPNLNDFPEAKKEAESDLKTWGIID
jgi:hypothetical protein